MDTVNTELIRGHVDTIILNSLVERDRYGYEILDIISNLSEGRYEIKQPTLYSCLKRLEKQGFISSYFGDETQGGRRRYYTLTEKGRDTLEQDQREWEFSRTIINRLLSDKEIDLKTVEAPFDPSELRPLTRRVRAYDSDEAAAAEQKAAASSMQENINAVSDQNAAVESKVEVESAKENVISVVAAAEAPTAPAAETAVQSTADKNGLGESVQPIRKPDIETLRKQTEASKFLKIGEFAEPTLLIPEENNVTKYTLSRDEEPVRREQPEQTSAASVAPAASVRREDFFQPVADEAFATKPSEKPLPPTPGQVYAPHAAHDDKQETGINYREALSAVYESAEHAHNTTEVFDTNPDPSESHAMLFGDLRQKLMDEGYRLRSYTKSNTSNYYYMKFVFSNQLLRTTGFLSYLWVGVLALLVFILSKTGTVNIGGAAALTIALAGLIIPVVTTCIWATNPKKRVKATFNSGAAIIYSAIAFVIISALVAVICLLASVDFSTGIPFIPMILATIIPVFALIYVLLYRSGNYHLK